MPPPAAAAVPFSPAPHVPLPLSENFVSPMRETSSGDSNAENIKNLTQCCQLQAENHGKQSETVDKILVTQGQQSKDMGRLELNMNELVGAVTSGFRTVTLNQNRLEHNQRELWSNQERNQKHNDSVHEVFDSRIKELELENARRNRGGAVSSPAPPPNASATASAVDEEMTDSSSPSQTLGSSQATVPAPVPQVSAPQPAPFTDHEMANSSPSKKMPSSARAVATSNEAVSSPFAVTSPKKISATCSSHVKTTTPTKPTINFGSPSNEAASSPFAPNVASSSVPVDTSPKKISASCSSKTTTTPTEPTFNMGFTPPKENKKNNKGIKKTARRSLKAMSRSSFASSSPKKKANVMRNKLVVEKRKKMAAPSPVKKPAPDISKSVTPKASNSAPVAQRYGTELVNGAVRDWNDSKHWTRIFCAEELVVVAGSAFKYDNVSQYCAELTSRFLNNFQKVVVLFQHVVDTGAYEKLVNEYITGLKTFRCGTEDKFEEEIKKGIDIAKLKGGMK